MIRSVHPIPAAQMRSIYDDPHDDREYVEEALPGDGLIATVIIVIAFFVGLAAGLAGVSPLAWVLS